MNTIDKVKTLSEATALIDAGKHVGKKIVVVSGSFDLLHAGHVHFLESARSLGDVLIVLLNSDASVRAYKGSTRPLIPEADRARMLAGLAAVDAVVLFDELTPLTILETLHPGIYANGADWGADCIEREVVERHGGAIQVIPLSEPMAHKSSRIIARIQDALAAPVTHAVFFDRDGTLTDDKDGYLHRVEDMELLPGAVEALQTISALGYKLFVISNQSGVGREKFSVEDVERTNAWLTDVLAKEGITLSGIYYCPHHPDDGCECRKPGVDLILQAAREHDISLNGSWMVGDKCSDVEAGKRSNMRTVLVSDGSQDCGPFTPAYAVKDLLEAASYIGEVS